ncbi:MAG: hypothetical protein WB952_10700 [Terriglobales bacterium]
MAKRKQPERWESTMLAAVLAVAGTLFLFDKLSSLMRNSSLSLQTIGHAAPLLLVVMAVSLMLADQGAVATDPREERGQGGHHERH